MPNHERDLTSLYPALPQPVLADRDAHAALMKVETDIVGLRDAKIRRKLRELIGLTRHGEVEGFLYGNITNGRTVGTIMTHYHSFRSRCDMILSAQKASQ